MLYLSIWKLLKCNAVEVNTDFSTPVFYKMFSSIAIFQIGTKRA